MGWGWMGWGWMRWGGAAQRATGAAEEGGATQMVAVETMESMEHNPDLAPGETTPPREEPNHCARGPAPEKKEKARRANPHLHLDHHAPSSRGVLLSAPMADVSPPPPHAHVAGLEYRERRTIFSVMCNPILVLVIVR
jgi:hypothetical protein